MEYRKGKARVGPLLFRPVSKSYGRQSNQCTLYKSVREEEYYIRGKASRSICECASWGAHAATYTESDALLRSYENKTLITTPGLRSSRLCDACYTPLILNYSYRPHSQSCAFPGKRYRSPPGQLCVRSILKNF